MNFKSAVIVFNLVVALFMFVVFFIPYAILGKDLAFDFWQSSWYLAPVLVAVLASVDIYFALNSRIFGLLEREDWPALVQELESRVLHKGRYSPRLVRLLTSAYLVLSNSRAVNALEQKLAAVKPPLVNTFALVFGAARLLSGDNSGAVEFFQARLPGGPLSAKIPSASREWLSWYYGFSLLMDRQFSKAAEYFLGLAGEASDGLVTGLSVSFLNGTLGKFLSPRDLDRRVMEGKERVLRSLGRRTDWNREVRRLETEIHAAVLTSYLEKAAEYIYA